MSKKDYPHGLWKALKLVILQILCHIFQKKCVIWSLRMLLNAMAHNSRLGGDRSYFRASRLQLDHHHHDSSLYRSSPKAFIEKIQLIRVSFGKI